MRANYGNYRQVGSGGGEAPSHSRKKSLCPSPNFSPIFITQNEVTLMKSVAEQNAEWLERWSVRMAKINNFGRVGMREVNPIPPGATRHPAISENCLRLSDGAEWMKYGGSR
jgi:hypothetical protein